MNYKEIDLWAGCTIEQAVRRLKDYNDKGVLVYCNFNEAILCSDTVTIEDAYIQVTGKTKAEFNKQHEEWRKEYDRVGII